MNVSQDFLVRLESKVSEQLAARRVGYLLGAGSSFLRGTGYPLSTNLWQNIRGYVPEPQRSEIEEKIVAGEGIEQALDLLDQGKLFGSKHRQDVTDAIAEHFMTVSPSLDLHAAFLQRLASRQEISVPVFSLNYDPLLERAAEHAKVFLRDGFQGVEHAYFDSRFFQQSVAVVHRGRSGTKMARIVPGIVDLFKLHGSLGWYEIPVGDVRRCGFSENLPAGSLRLMVPPQWRKVNDTLAVPYETLWSEFRRLTRHGPYVLNRLVVVGYGMADSHVNGVLEAALARSDFTLMIFGKDLRPDAFARWTRPGVVIVTESRCSLYGETGPGHFDLWSFERLSKEV
jgi:hypothetical protein